MSISRLARQMKKKGREEKTAVIVGTVTDDSRMYELPKLNVRLLRWIMEATVLYRRFAPYV